LLYKFYLFTEHPISAMKFYINYLEYLKYLYKKIEIFVIS